MKGVVNRLLLVVVLAAGAFGVAAQKSVSFDVPFDFPLLLSGNFGELRSNHFHAGLDFKTQGVTGKPIKCVADGYICRAKVQSGGYGLALYVMHDNGYMTVYGHLEQFPAGVAKRVRDFQYSNEVFEVDMNFTPSEFRVERGEILALAGNTGYSFGPHLHFEVRDSTGNELYDPMTFYKGALRDSRAPQALSVAVYPKRGEGVVNGTAVSKTCKVIDSALTDTIEVWGKVGFGVKALDYMDNTHNKYGVRRIELLVDGVKRFGSELDNFSFDENRLINAWVDYERHINDGEWYQKMFVDAFNPLRAISADDAGGWVTVDEERLYNVECRLSDFHGNTGVCVFVVKGKRSTVQEQQGYTHVLYRGVQNVVDFMGMKLEVPAGELFDNAFLNVTLVGTGAFSGRYDLGGVAYPLWHGGVLSLRVDDLKGVDPAKLYMKRITKKGGHSVGGKFADGCLVAKVNILGCYEVAADTVPPRVRPVKEAAWARNAKVVLAVADGETSIKSFKGKLNGEFVLFEYSSKNSRLTLDLKKENIRRGVHDIEVSVVDACGNETTYRGCLKY